MTVFKTGDYVYVEGEPGGPWEIRECADYMVRLDPFVGFVEVDRLCPALFVHEKSAPPVHKTPAPSHYIDGRDPVYEPRHVIRAWGLNYHLGSAVKYISRAGRKGGPAEHIRDLEKAIDFLRFELEALRATEGEK